jgi:periplasmic divalent cation tolerance protein
MEFRSIYFTTRDEAEAKRIGRMLVWERLVACVNYNPIKSIYWWEGNPEEGNEYAVIAKTREEMVDKVISRIKELHSYEVPCVVSWIIEKGNPAYLEWIKESTEQS